MDVSVWTPLVAVLVGAVLGGGFNILVSVRNHVQIRKRNVADLRRETYFFALDSVHQLRKSLQNVAASASGRWEPGPEDKSPEAEEMRRRDEDAGRAFESLNLAMDGLRIALLRARAVGSLKVSESVVRLEKRVGTYFVDVSKELPKFKGNTFRVFLDDSDVLVDELVADIRVDLEVDAIYTLRGAKTWNNWNAKLKGK